MVNLFRSASIDPRVSFRCVFIRWRRLASALYFLSATGAHVAQRRGRRPRPSTVAINPSQSMQYTSTGGVRLVKVAARVKV